MVVRDRKSGAWSKWRELVSLLVNHRIPLEERVKADCACVRPALLYAAKIWILKERLEGPLASCDYRILRYILRVRWPNRITNEEVRR